MKGSGSGANKDFWKEHGILKACSAMQSYFISTRFIKIQSASCEDGTSTPKRLRYIPPITFTGHYIFFGKVSEGPVLRTTSPLWKIYVRKMRSADLHAQGYAGFGWKSTNFLRSSFLDLWTQYNLSLDLACLPFKKLVIVSIILSC